MECWAESVQQQTDSSQDPRSSMPWSAKTYLSFSCESTPKTTQSRFAKRLVAACALWKDAPSLKEAAPSAITLRLDRAAPLSVYAVYLASNDNDLKEHLLQYVEKWRHTKTSITGHDLRASGLSPGPHYAKILQTLRAAWLDGEIVNEQEENKLFQKLVREQ